MRATITTLLLGVGILLTTGIHRDEPGVEATTHLAPLSDATFSVTSAHGRITVTGTTASATHEESMRRLVAEYFPGASAEIRFRPGILPGERWESSSARLLYVIAAMESAVAEMRPDTISIRGVASATESFSTRAEFLQKNLPAEVALTTDVVVITSQASFDELCERAFTSLVLGPVLFQESSTEIRRASLVTLDRITEFARDCPSVSIAITGHTDASGDETWNRRLSIARAQAVADHIAANGIEPARLIVSGLGSSAPIADNSTARGREQNRRIEFELR